jgi:hypothetical protein
MEKNMDVIIQRREKLLQRLNDEENMYGGGTMNGGMNMMILGNQLVPIQS